MTKKSKSKIMSKTMYALVDENFCLVDEVLYETLTEATNGAVDYGDDVDPIFIAKMKITHQLKKASIMRIVE